MRSGWLGLLLLVGHLRRSGVRSCASFILMNLISYSSAIYSASSSYLDPKYGEQKPSAGDGGDALLLVMIICLYVVNCTLYHT